MARPSYIPRTLLKISSLADSCCLWCSSLGSFADDGLCRWLFPNLLIGTGSASGKNSGGIAWGPEQLVRRLSWLLFISSVSAPSNSATPRFTATNSTAFSSASFSWVRLSSKVEIARPSWASRSLTLSPSAHFSSHTAARFAFCSLRMRSACFRWDQEMLACVMAILPLSLAAFLAFLIMPWFWRREAFSLTVQLSVTRILLGSFRF